MLLSADRRRSLGALLTLLLGAAACVPSQQTTPTGPPQPTAREAQPAEPETQPEGTQVALLLPLSGGAEAIGRDMLDAAQMAIFDVGQTDISLLPRDTGDTPEMAEAAAREAIGEGAGLILGPLFASATRAVAPVAQEQGVPVLSFSNDASAATGDVFVLGYRPEEQVERIVRHAESQGFTDLGLVAPDDTYGVVATRAFNLATRQARIEGRSAFYPAEQGDPGDAVAAVLQGGSPAAVLLPDAGEGLLQAAEGVRASADAPVQLLGTSRWTDDESALRDPVLSGAWLAATAPGAKDAFSRRFSAVYGREPHELAALAYDAAALAALLAQSDASFPRDLLTDPQGFVGSLGIFRLRQDGTAQHGLAILEARPEGLFVIEPAPQSFVDEVALN
jgi:branched-chain amino acid transport system substrate-binding protein